MNTRILTYSLLLAAAPLTAFAQTTFTKIILNDLGATGCAWGDVNNDGLLDLFCAEYTGTNVFYLNNTNGTFTRITEGAVVNDLSRAFGVQWVDYDNDGFMDLLVVNNFMDFSNFQGGLNFLYHNNRDGTFTRVLTNAVATDRGSAVALCGAWGDYDNDGFQDLFVTSGEGEDQNLFYHNNGDGTF